MPITQEWFEALFREVESAVRMNMEALTQCLALSIEDEESAGAIKSALLIALTRLLGDMIATEPDPEGRLLETTEFMAWCMAQKIEAAQERPNVLH